MPNRSPSKQRLEELIALARTYRGWSNKDLARELGRDTHHLIPESGVPKLDIVIALADALDWTVQDVVDDLCGNIPASRAEKPKETWAELDRAAYEAICAGQFEKCIAIAKRELAVATSGVERASAYSRLFVGWESLGAYLNAAEAVERGLAERGLAPEVTLNLRNNLAHVRYLLGHSIDAEGIATSTLAMIAEGALTSRFQDAGTGYAHLVRGQSRRVIAGAQHVVDGRVAEQALADLLRSIELHDAEFHRHQLPAHDLAAHTARGALLEVEAMLGVRSPAAAIERIVTELEDVVDPARLPREGRLEAYGWWCVYGANVALRAPIDPIDRERLMGLFTNKADEIAERLENWALRERVWALELSRRTSPGAPEDEWLVDREDVRQISGAMARFPAFRPIGWQVLRSVRLSDLDERGSK